MNQPFRTALGRKTFSENLLVKITLSDGSEGVGEASSSLAMPQATVDKMRGFLLSIQSQVLGQEISNWQNLLADLELKNPEHPTALAALGAALLLADFSNPRKFFGRKNETLETAYTLSQPTAAGVEKAARQKRLEKYSLFKLKLFGLRSDLARIEAAARQTSRPLLLDANQAYEPALALELLEKCARKKIKIALFEQPCAKANFEGLAFIKSRGDVAVAADESVRSLADAERLIALNAVDVLNLKLAKLGLLQALKIARLARRKRIKLMIGCMMESLLGLYPSLAWAAGSGIFSWVDLDSFLLLKPQRQNLPIRVSGARIQLLA